MSGERQPDRVRLQKVTNRAFAGVPLLETLARDNRIRIGFAVRRKAEKPANQNASGTAGRKRLVAYLDAIGEIDGMHCLVDWK